MKYRIVLAFHEQAGEGAYKEKYRDEWDFPEEDEAGRFQNVVMTAIELLSLLWRGRRL